jgi:hypothetical protein
LELKIEQKPETLRNRSSSEPDGNSITKKKYFDLWNIGSPKTFISAQRAPKTGSNSDYEGNYFSFYQCIKI